MGVSDDREIEAAQAAPLLSWWNLFSQAELQMLSPVAPAQVKARLQASEVSVSQFGGSVIVRLDSRRRNFTETWASVHAEALGEGSQLRLRYGTPIWIMLPLVALVLFGVVRLAMQGDYLSAGTWGCVFLGLLLFGRFLGRDDARRLHGHIVRSLDARIDPLHGAIG
jgi:hypothetical protein